MSNPKIICFANQKGGVAKSVSCINTGSVLAIEGKRVLYVDLDPQSNVTKGFGVNDHNDRPNIFDVFNGVCSLEETIVPTPYGDVAPCSTKMGYAERVFVLPAKEWLLERALSQVRDLYDYILIDTPSSFGLLVENALTAADSVVVPVSPEKWSNTAIDDLLAEVELIRQTTNDSLDIAGILLTKVDRRTNNAKICIEITKLIAEQTGIHIFNSFIINAVKINDVLTTSQNLIGDYPTSRPAICYREFAHELERRVA